MQAIVREKPIMKTFIVAAALALLGPLGAAAQQTATAEQQIASATHILPQHLRAGTPGAHIMIPIDPPAKSSTITDAASDEITQATLPLPDDLRKEASVYKYDPKTGERIWLRKGTNFAECTPRGDDGFTWCYNRATAPRRDFSTKLRAQGKAEKEIQEAVASA